MPTIVHPPIFDVPTLRDMGGACSRQFAICSGNIDAAGAITIKHKSSSIGVVTFDPVGETLTVNFSPSFDAIDGIYFAVAFTYGAGGAVLIPTTMTGAQVILSGGGVPIPCTFAFFAATS